MTRCLSFPLAGSALKWIRFHVPEWAVRGGEVMLTCQFDLAQDRLYSVKWYKAGREFYRYVPAEKPAKQAFPFKGVAVDVSVGGGWVAAWM